MMGRMISSLRRRGRLDYYCCGQQLYAGSRQRHAELNAAAPNFRKLVQLEGLPNTASRCCTGAQVEWQKLCKAYAGPGEDGDGF